MSEPVNEIKIAKQPATTSEITADLTNEHNVTVEDSSTQVKHVSAKKNIRDHMYSNIDVSEKTMNIIIAVITVLLIIAIIMGIIVDN